MSPMLNTLWRYPPRKVERAPSFVVYHPDPNYFTTCSPGGDARSSTHQREAGGGGGAKDYACFDAARRVW